MPGSLLGNSVQRLEDPELLLGHGTFVGNLRIEGLARAVFVRSPYAHARIVSVDAEEARKAPGVIGVFTAADLGIEPFHGLFVLNPSCPRPPLADGKVCFVGDPVAMVVAETESAAVDAAELVVVDYEPLEAVIDPEAALADGAPLQFEALGTNLAAGMADPAEPDPLAGAVTIVRAQLENQRLAVVPMEGDAIAAVPGDDGDGHDLTVYVSTQMPHGLADAAARDLGLDRARLRVVAPNVGGAFGSKAGLGAEHAAVIVGARRLGRPVMWVQTRSENLVATPHGRGQTQWVELGFDGDGHDHRHALPGAGDAGAYAGFGGALALGPTRMMAQGVYDIPAIRYDVAVAVTNTTPDGCLPRRRPAGGGRVPRADDRHRRRRARHRSGRAAPAQPAAGLRASPYHDRDGRRPTTSATTGSALDEALRLAGYEELRAEQAAGVRRATAGSSASAWPSTSR